MHRLKLVPSETSLSLCIGYGEKEITFNLKIRICTTTQAGADPGISYVGQKGRGVLISKHGI